MCYGEQILGLDVCLRGEYIEQSQPDKRVYPFCGPSKYNVFIKPGINPATKIQFKVKYTHKLTKALWKSTLSRWNLEDRM